MASERSCVTDLTGWCHAIHSIHVVLVIVAIVVINGAADVDIVSSAAIVSECD